MKISFITSTLQRCATNSFWRSLGQCNREGGAIRYDPSVNEGLGKSLRVPREHLPEYFENIRLT